MARLLSYLPFLIILLDLIEDERPLLLGILDILFAYCYNHRTSEGENTVESTWTIWKLSSTLSCLETFSNPRETMIASVRRSLAYPLYRNWKLSTAVLKDVIALLRLGKLMIVKVFLEMYQMFERDELRFYVNSLYIQDYCLWIQQLSDTKISALGSELRSLELAKGDVGWQLEQLEKEMTAYSHMETVDDEM